MSQGQNLLARTKGELMRSFWFKLFLGMTALLIVAVLVTAGVFVLNRSASETVIQQALDRDMRENGYLIEPGDISGLAEAIIAILTDAELAERLSRNNISKAVTEYSMKVCSMRIGNVYKGLIADAK